MGKILDYIRLVRLQTAAATATAPVVAALTAGQRVFVDIFTLFLIGVLYHVYGFVLNEYFDMEVDSKSPDLSRKPLVSKRVPGEHALIISFIAVIFIFAISLVFYPFFYSTLFLLLAVLFGGFYDVFGKKIPGSDFVLGLGFFFLCLFGASTFSGSFTVRVYVVSGIYFLQIVFNNAVEGGLKDVDHDFLANVKTLVLWMGVRLKNGKLVITKTFKVFAFSLRFLFVVFIFFLVIHIHFDDVSMFHKVSLTNLPHVFWFQIITTASLTFLMAIIFYKFLKIKDFDRAKLKRLFSIHEILSYYILIIALSPLFDVVVTVSLLLLPSLWYVVFNNLLYRTSLQPGV